jgi:AraC family transcriptional regulator
MKGGNYFGKAVVQAPVARKTHAFVSNTHGNTPMAVTHIVLDGPSPEIMKMPLQEACIFTVSARGGYGRDLYLEDRISPIDTPVPEGSFSFFDMRQRGRLRPTSMAEDVQFFFPIESINAIADENGRPGMDALGLSAGQVVADPTLQRLANALMPSFRRPAEASRMFIDHIMLAAATHVAISYGGLEARGRHSRGGLAPWQERRAMEILASDLSGSVPLAEIARVCGFSARHFSRAFSQSTGFAPHQWLLRLRIERSKDMLKSSYVALAEIARLCGFSDQSHYTRIFSQQIGLSPGAWRRRHFVGTPAEARRLDADKSSSASRADA